MFALLFLLLVHPGHCAQDTRPRVGFNLAFDYGSANTQDLSLVIHALTRSSTASVDFANGTRANIAKIEGGHAYKQMMRGYDWTNPYQSLPAAQPPSPQRFLDFLCSQWWFDRFTLFLGGEAHSDPPADALQRMLLALKVASESFLDDSVDEVGLVVPTTTSPHFRIALDSAATSLNLTGLNSEPASRPMVYASTAARRQNLHRQPEILLLSVEWSDAALLADLYLADVYEGSYGVIHRKLDPSLGASVWSETSRGRTIATLRDLLVDFRYESPYPYPQDVHAVIIFGEKGCDPRILNAVQDALCVVGSLYQLQPAEQCSAVESLFAASREAATQYVRLGDRWLGCVPSGENRLGFWQELEHMKHRLKHQLELWNCEFSEWSFAPDMVRRLCEATDVFGWYSETRADREYRRTRTRGGDRPKRDLSYFELAERESKRQRIGN